MGDIELRITRDDWFSVFLIGISFSTLLSMLSYYILRLSLSDGVLFGVFLGFFITCNNRKAGCEIDIQLVD
jgi:uncharacterized membrane protein YdjX (TVP38/TMEM64 family)